MKRWWATVAAVWLAGCLGEPSSSVVDVGPEVSPPGEVGVEAGLDGGPETGVTPEMGVREMGLHEMGPGEVGPDRVDDGVACDTERCNGRDDDCDGAIDESLAFVGEPCAVGAGACMVEGIRRCFEGPDGWAVACDAEAGDVMPERCDGIDEDCDGMVDEDVEGVDEPCAAGEGVCLREGRWRCPIGDGSGAEMALACDAVAGAPADEVCNGLDDDCDGALDEQAAGTGEACVAGRGACAAEGVTVCEAGPPGVEAPPVCDAAPGLPRDEVCDGIDDDCDGRLDEQVPGVGDACQVGVGGCNGVGRRVCRAEPGSGMATDLSCDAIAGQPGAEVCNGLDDDCDGRLDEDTAGGECATGRPGICAAGDLVCDGGRAVCVGRSDARAEGCNGLDDDCDGAVDDGVQNRFCGGCGPFPAEQCNGADDDCDGSIDEDLAGCGLAIACGVFSIRNGQAGVQAFPAVSPAFGGDVTRLIAVHTYRPEGDQQFEYRLAVEGANMRYTTGRGNDRSYVAGWLCSLGHRGTAGATVGELTVAGESQGRVGMRAPAVLGPERDAVAFPLVTDYTSGGDDDYWFAAGVTNPDGAGEGTLEAWATNLGRPQITAQYVVIEASRMRLESTTFDIRTDARDPQYVVVPEVPGYTRWGVPVLSVGRMQTGGPDGGDDDMWYQSACEALGNTWRCRFDAGGADRDTARIAGQIISFWRPR